jgi:eukaryotic-like serine/threonine-protein kinase
MGLPPSSPSLPDSIGRYEVVRRLGQGAMGRVLLAEDPVLGRHVAIKLLRNDLGLSPEHQRQLFERMRQEARASARVSHPNIVALFDMGEDELHGLYLVFEYVLGATLKDRIMAGPLDAVAVARMAGELGEALSTAHAAGVLHRDIKPENVILAPTGAKIADFGIARLPESTLTRDGRLLGTPAYSSPESIAHGVFSAASDQFSLATTLYEALSQSRAFPGDDAVRVASLITTTEAPPIAEHCDLDAAVDNVLRKAMHRNPNARFPSCAEFGHALAVALGQCGGRVDQRDPVLAAAGAAPPRERDIGSRTLRVVAGAGALGALVMAAVLQLTRGCRAEPSVPQPNTGVLAPQAASAKVLVSSRKLTRTAASASRSAVASESAPPNHGAGPPPAATRASGSD